MSEPSVGQHYPWPISPPFRPDPRISNMRPGWLADDEAWRDQLQAMEEDDCDWIAKHWDMAGGKRPAVDTSWVTTEEIGPSWGIGSLIAAVVLGFVIIVIGGGALITPLLERIWSGP